MAIHTTCSREEYTAVLPGPRARNEALEALMGDDHAVFPDCDAARVYGDWLLSQGDAMGAALIREPYSARRLLATRADGRSVYSLQAFGIGDSYRTAGQIRHGHDCPSDGAGDAES